MVHLVGHVMSFMKIFIYIILNTSLRNDPFQLYLNEIVSSRGNDKLFV